MQKPVKTALDVLKIGVILTIAVGIIFLGYNNFKREVYPIYFEEYVREFSEKRDVCAYLIFAIIKNESGFNPNAISRADAFGLMQITEDTFEWIAQIRGGREVLPDIKSPFYNIMYGTAIIASHLEEFYSEKEALAAYHAGRGAVNEWLSSTEFSSDGIRLDVIPFPDTEIYVGRVLEAWRMYKRLYK